MSDTEIILLFKKDSGMSDEDWVRFCVRYAGKNSSTVVELLREICAENGIALPKSLNATLKNEMRRVKEKAMQPC